MEDKRLEEEQVDVLMDSLSHATRRRILLELRGADPRGGIDLRSLGERTRVPSTIELYHVHVPKLDDGELVSWERDSGVVRRGPQFDVALQLLESLDQVDPD